MDSAEPASRPSWLPGSGPAPAQPAAAGAAQPAAAGAASPPYRRHRAYAEWYAWARTLVADQERCHAAAAAAVDGIEGGQPQPVVTEMAGKIAQGAPSIAPEADADTRRYAGWFAWANLEMKLEKERAHLAAQVATEVQDQGLGPGPAADAAMRAAGIPAGYVARSQVQVSVRVRNGALLNLGWGVACIVIPFAFNWYFPIAPIFGLVWGVRTLRFSRHWLVLAALAVNALAMLLNILILAGDHLLR